MEEFIRIVLSSGRTALELALYVLLPVLVIMMALMKVIEARGILALVARAIQPVMKLFGIPGAGVFAMQLLLLVSFAAPLTYYLFARSVDGGDLHVVVGEQLPPKKVKSSLLNLMIVGGQEAVQVILGAIPILILAVFLKGHHL